jgi:hypothetical protein
MYGLQPMIESLMQRPIWTRTVAVTLAAAIAGTGSVLAQEDKTGTDPRGFSSKFMPYYLHTKLENDLEVDQLNLFGMYAFSPKVAMTFDLPVWKEVDASDVSGFKMLSSGTLPPIGPIPGFGGGLPFAQIPSDGKQDGIGDLGLRFFYKPDATQFEASSHMFGFEVTLPTATEDILGGETYVLSPMYVYVRNVKLLSPGFFALMNFYDFDVAKADDDRADVSRFRGRWFLMQPLSRPGPRLLDGIYLLPELQPVYDFETDHFSLWVAPELGKMLPWGAIYIKPGIGVSGDEPGDRDWTLEVGFRYFFK